jgi:hypothetical protein
MCQRGDMSPKRFVKSLETSKPKKPTRNSDAGFTREQETTPFQKLTSRFTESLAKLANRRIKLGTNQMGERMLEPWIRDTKAHWKQHRPKMYADLVAKGKLDSHAQKAAEQTSKEYQAGITNGMDPQASWESVRENHMFLPDEEDQPSLGESPEASQGPTNLEPDHG